MKYKIGQVLYVLLNRETKISPVQVVEEITKRSINGETTTYLVKAGRKADPVSLSDIDGQVFDSIETLRTTLHNRVLNTIDTVINTTMKRASEWYPEASPPEQKNPELIEVEDQTVITLEDGTTAKLRMPF